MKIFIATTAAVALLATGAYANPNEDDDPTTGRVTLNATVGEYIAITSTSNSTIGDLNVLANSNDAANNNVNNNAGDGKDKSLFTVAANVNFDIDLAWATWDAVDLPDGAPEGYNQAYYFNSAADEGDGCAIGGTIHFDADPDTDGAVSYPGSGESPWTLEDFTLGMNRTFGIGTQASPDINNCPGDIAAPGTYSLDVDITVSKHS